jgi:hypothetical protein
MPKTIAREDHHVLVTIGYLEKYPNMGVLDAMKLGDFTKEERNDHTKRAWIYRRWNGKKTSALNPLVLSIMCDTQGMMSSVTCDVPSPPKVKRSQKTAAGKQSERAAKQAKKIHFNAAFKHATGLYSSKKKKGMEGMSAREVIEVVMGVLTAACKAFSLANGKGTGTNDWVIRSLVD